MCTPNSWTCLGRGLRRVLRVFWRGGSARVYKFSADGWGPIPLWRPADEVQATQHLALPAVQGDKINGALGGLHLVGHSQRRDSRAVVQAQRHLSRAVAAEPEVFRPFRIWQIRVRIAFKPKESSLLQIAERLSTGRIAALIKQEYLTHKAG